MSLSALLYAFLATIGILFGASFLLYCLRLFGLGCYQEGIVQGYYACLLKAGNTPEQAIAKMKEELIIVKSTSKKD